MNVETTSVTVNAAFLQEIKEDNLRLIALRRELRDALQSESSLDESDESYKPVVELLVDLREQLTRHFSLEETYGYMNDPIEVAPRLCEQANCLRREHQDLCSEISDIANLAERCDCHDSTDLILDKIFARMTALLDQFDRHETEENALIQQAMNDDIGTGD